MMKAAEAQGTIYGTETPSEGGERRDAGTTTRLRKRRRRGRGGAAESEPSGDDGGVEQDASTEEAEPVTEEHADEPAADEPEPSTDSAAE